LYNFAKQNNYKQTVSSEKEEENVYDIQGRHINKLQRGINILRMSDGTTRKVLIK
jgi:hypothetical protein